MYPNLNHGRSESKAEQAMRFRAMIHSEKWDIEKGRLKESRVPKEEIPETNKYPPGG